MRYSSNKISNRLNANNVSSNSKNEHELVQLKAVFERFHETSERLEIRYESLRREAEELRARLEQKEKEIKRSEKLATLGETAAALAHEVRNPLGSIKLFSSLIKRDAYSPEQVLKLIEQIDVSVTNLEGVISNILLFAKDTNRAFTIVNVHSILKELCQSLSQLNPNLKFDLELKGSPFIQANESALRQAFYNLLLNAIQASGNKAQIEIRSHESDPTGKVAGDLTLIISDNGPGIAEPLLTKIFDPFVSSKAEGTGLGLAIVRKIINEHAGSITAANRNLPENGAVFTLVLPQLQSMRETKRQT